MTPLRFEGGTVMTPAERLGMYDRTKLDMSAPVQSLGRMR